MIEYDELLTHNIHMLMGRPKSGKTMIAGSYPKPLLYVSVGNDGGGRVLMLNNRDDVVAGNIKVKNLRNDPIVNGKIAKTSIEKLAELLRDLRKPDADRFKTIVIDTVGALQDDYKAYMEFNKGGMAISQQEWGDVAKMMLNAKDNMKRFSEEFGTIFVWVTHTRDLEVTESSGLEKEIHIIPDMTVNTGIKYMKDATNICYVCRKTTINKDGERDVKFLTYVGPHPLMDTGTRDIVLKRGGFIEDFTYDKWQDICKNGKLMYDADIIVPETTKENDNNEKEIEQ